jgi:hypothetical protein
MSPARAARTLSACDSKTVARNSSRTPQDSEELNFAARLAPERQARHDHMRAKVARHHVPGNVDLTPSRLGRQELEELWHG